jgi:hypothetical protein
MQTFLFSVPLLGNHGCALCKCELHRSCSVFFSRNSRLSTRTSVMSVITSHAVFLENLPITLFLSLLLLLKLPQHPTVLMLLLPEVMNALILKLLLLPAKLLLLPAKLVQPKLPLHPKVLLPKLLPLKLPLHLKVLLLKLLPLKLPLHQNKQKNALKSYNLKAVTWEDIIVGEVPSTRAQDKGMMVKSVVGISLRTLPHIKSDKFSLF